MRTAIQAFTFLEGAWRFHRTISTGATVEGTAVFAKRPDTDNTLDYREDGTCTMPEGSIFTAYMKYVYRFHNEKISVHFADDRFFHALQFHLESDPLTATAQHLCVCDTYQATYTFFERNRFQLLYEVQGPKKNYTIKTLFTKGS